MKILIMVLSYDQIPFDTLMRSQIESWDNIPEENINTLFYYGSPHPEIHHKVIRQHHKSASHVLLVPARDDYYYMAGKFQMALGYVRDWDYDIIFRTNSSSLVNKKQLVKFAQTLPKEKLYAGWTMKDTNHDGGDCVSGAGIFLSRDTAEILMNEIDPNVEMEEDVYCGRILRSHGIKAIDDRSRLDWVGGLQQNITIGKELNPYHIRFKTNNRFKDAENMREVNEKIIRIQCSN